MLIDVGLGLLVGAIMALTGAGGGILAVPILVFGLQMSVVQAGPIGLMAVGIAAAIATALGLKDGVVRYRAAALMAGAGALLSPLGVWLASRLDNRWLSILFGGVLLFVAYRSYRHAHGDDVVRTPTDDGALPCRQHTDSGRFIWTTTCARALCLSGAAAGFLSGLLGVGGGFVMVPALRRYSDLSAQSVIATSLAVIALISIVGVIASASSGGMNWVIALPFSAGAVAGIVGGRLITTWLKGSHLQMLFAAVCAVVAISMAMKGLTSM